jgi:hypothetical protein
MLILPHQCSTAQQRPRLQFPTPLTMSTGRHLDRLSIVVEFGGKIALIFRSRSKSLEVGGSVCREQLLLQGMTYS